MGTRSLTVFKDENEREIAVMYRQFDGYPTGQGAELKEFLAPFRLINGIRNLEEQNVANGIDCLAAQVVAHFKQHNRIGNIYLMPSGTRDVGEHYIYTLTPGPKGRINLKVEDTYFKMVLFNGNIRLFGPKATEKREAIAREALAAEIDHSNFMVHECSDPECID